jgi:hypothetical protein
MTSIIFYASIVYYCFMIYTVEHFNILGKEFVSMVVLGLLANLQKKGNKQ